MHPTSFHELLISIAEKLPKHLKPLGELMLDDQKHLQDLAKNMYTPRIMRLLHAYLICKAQSSLMHTTRADFENVLQIDKKHKFHKYKRLLLSHASNFLQNVTLNQHRYNLYQKVSSKLELLIQKEIITPSLGVGFTSLVGEICFKIDERFIFSKHHLTNTVITTVRSLQPETHLLELIHDLQSLFGFTALHDHILRAYKLFTYSQDQLLEDIISPTHEIITKDDAEISS